MRLMTIFFDSRYMQVSAEDLARLTPGTLAGRGVFETLGFSDGKPLFWDEHWQRMRKGLVFLGQEMPDSSAAVKNIVRTLVRKNSARVVRARIMVWHDGRRQRLCVSAHAPRERDRSKQKNGFSCCIASAPVIPRRRSYLKSIQYRVYHDAYVQAQSRGFDEAILLNSHGKLVEGARTNIFFAKNSILYTPALLTGCLKGIIRDKVMGLAHAQGISCRVVNAGPRALLSCDEAFLTNSAIGIVPIIKVNGMQFARGAPGSITQNLVRVYYKSIRQHSSRS